MQSASKHQILAKFFTGFKAKDALTMTNQYAKDARFKDPVFGELHGERIGQMWQMLLSNKGAQLKIEFKILSESDTAGSAVWKATYLFGPKRRTVINHVKSEFVLKNGKISSQIDTFNMWKWSIQALGWQGYLLGWSSLMRNSIRKGSLNALQKHIARQE